MDQRETKEKRGNLIDSLYFLYMKSLQESLFDTDLAQKDLPTIGSNYKLASIKVSWGDYYSNYNGLEEDLDLVDKIFKVNKLKSIKPISLDGVELDWYKTHLEFYDPFARLLTLVSNFYFNEKESIEENPRFDTSHRYGFDVCKDDWGKLSPYIYMGKTEVRMWKPWQPASTVPKDRDSIYFSVCKNFGSSTKYLQFKAVFERK